MCWVQGVVAGYGGVLRVFKCGIRLETVMLRGGYGGRVMVRCAMVLVRFVTVMLRCGTVRYGDATVCYGEATLCYGAATVRYGVLRLV